MMPDNDRPAETPIFSALLTPHRSLDHTGFVIVMAAIGVVSFAAGLVFLILGAWPVFGFFGLDVLLVYWAFRANYRGAAAYEQITVTPGALRVRKVSARGQVQEWTLNPAWVRLDREIDEEFGLQRLDVISQGRRLPVADLLGPAEREDFADTLADAIGAAKRGPSRSAFG